MNVDGNRSCAQNKPHASELSELLKWTWFVWVSPVEVQHKLLCMSELCSEDPGQLLIGTFVARPLDQIEELCYDHAEDKSGIPGGGGTEFREEERRSSGRRGRVLDGVLHWNEDLAKLLVMPLRY